MNKTRSRDAYISHFVFLDYSIVKLGHASEGFKSETEKLAAFTQAIANLFLDVNIFGFAGMGHG